MLFGSVHWGLRYFYFLYLVFPPFPPIVMIKYFTPNLLISFLRKICELFTIDDNKYTTIISVESFRWIIYKFL